MPILSPSNNKYAYYMSYQYLVYPPLRPQLSFSIIYVHMYVRLFSILSGWHHLICARTFINFHLLSFFYNICFALLDINIFLRSPWPISKR